MLMVSEKGDIYSRVYVFTRRNPFHYLNLRLDGGEGVEERKRERMARKRRRERVPIKRSHFSALRAVRFAMSFVGGVDIWVYR